MTIRSFPQARAPAPRAPIPLMVLALSLFAACPIAAEARTSAEMGAAPRPAAVRPATLAGTRAPAAEDLPNHLYLPVVGYEYIEWKCPTTSTAQWAQIAPWQRLITGAATSPDLNLCMRSWYRVPETLGFSRYLWPGGAPPDQVHPLHLSNVVAGATVSSFHTTYQIRDWDWIGCGCPVPRSRDPYPVTMLGLSTTPGQPLRIAGRNAGIDTKGHIAMVLYADAHQLALKYTTEDRVDNGYMMHLENLCVDPNLVGLYARLDREGRANLPAVSNDSIVGTARGVEVDVVVRDSGSFMDPRSWQDWWQDLPAPSGR